VSHDDRDTWTDWDSGPGGAHEPYDRPVDLRGACRASDDGPPDQPERSEAEDERQHRLYCQALDRAAAKDHRAEREAS
jgi:hypothetical protein